MFFFGNGAVNRRNHATAANFLRKMKKIVVAQMDCAAEQPATRCIRLRPAFATTKVLKMRMKSLLVARLHENPTPLRKKEEKREGKQ